MLSKYKLPTKPIRWLLAELLVIVLGILLAFQVEEWRNERLDRELEKSLLTSLIADLDSYAFTLQKFFDSSVIQTEASIELVAYLENEPNRELQKLEKLYEEIGSMWAWQPSKPTFEAWVNSGRPDLVSNKQLQEDLYYYYGPYENHIARLASELRVQLGEWRDVAEPDYHKVAIKMDSANSFTRKSYFVEPLNDIPRNDRFIIKTRRLGNRTARVITSLTRSLERTDALKKQIETHLQTL